MAQLISDASGAYTLAALVSSSPSETINTETLAAQMLEFTKAQPEDDVDPPPEEIEQVLEATDLPADLKRHLFELAALAAQVRKWERETETFVQFVAATADSALTKDHLATRSVLAESHAAGTKSAAVNMEDVSSA